MSLSCTDACVLETKVSGHKIFNLPNKNLNLQITMKVSPSLSIHYFKHKWRHPQAVSVNIHFMFTVCDGCDQCLDFAVKFCH